MKISIQALIALGLVLGVPLIAVFWPLTPN